MSKAKEAGLRILSPDHALYRDHASVDDKLYNPRAGFGAFYRWKPRNITAMCEKHGITPKLHLSVLERIAHGTDDYVPGNLPPNAGVAFTPTGDPDKDDTLLLRANAAKEVLQMAHRGDQAGRSLLADTQREIATGMVSYYLFLLTILATLFAASAPDGGGTFLEHLKSTGALLGHLVTLQWGKVGESLRRLLDTQWLLAMLASGYLLSWTLAFTVDRRMSDKFSEFWHRQQPLLRAALKRARERAKALHPAA